MRPMRASTAALLVLLAGPAAAQDATCAWSRVAPEGTLEGPCTVQATPSGLTVSMGTRDWFIREYERVGPWSRASLNGLEAMMFEIDPLRRSYATADLNERLEVAQ